MYLAISASQHARIFSFPSDASLDTVFQVKSLDRRNREIVAVDTDTLPMASSFFYLFR